MKRSSSTEHIISFVVLSLSLTFLLTPCVSEFIPADNILLNCGAASDARDGDNRLWIGDSNSPYSPPISRNSFVAQAASSDNSLPSPIPYMTARIITEATSYNFSLSNGGHFVRLYFYPSSYNNRKAEDAIFSVTTGPYTLLSNFNVSVNAIALNHAYIIHEYYIMVSGGSLVLTFTPSTNATNAFALINGIEIVSSPELFGSDPSNSSSIVGITSERYPVYASSSLQTIIRLNVGGGYVSPVQDSNLSRFWYGDIAYLYGAGFGVSYPADPSITFRYPPAVPDYIAPKDVYLTARSMGPSVSVNTNYNLTWLITVDNGFYYLLRLHFCEIQTNISKLNQRAFDVLVNNGIAETGLDVIGHAMKEVNSGSYNGVPVYRDYAIYVPGGGVSDLWLALRPTARHSSQFADAILNGMELFKLNSTSGNLAGPNPSLSLLPSPPNSSGHSRGKFTGALGLAIGGAASGLAIILIGFCVFFCLHKKREPQVEEQSSKNRPPRWRLLSQYSPDKSTIGTATTTSSGKTGTTGSYASSHPSDLCRHFTISEISVATNNFDDSLLLGVGGFGKVYKGTIGNGINVAIKRGNPLSDQGVHEFQTEIETLSKLRHQHLVSLIGYCEENREMILVYDYMAQGTLREHLYKSSKPPLSWKQRLEICVGAARGLHYLHTGAKHSIIHRDVKTTNILLDEKWVAKVADFGLSKTGPAMDRTHVSTVVKGSFGYLDPEYYRRQQLTEKSDVYSFGVVLFEVLCARPAVNAELPRDQISLAEWAIHCQKQGRLQQIIDPLLRGKIVPECFRKFAETAAKCLAEKGVDRPSMHDVLWNLEFALRLQRDAEESNKWLDSLPEADTNELPFPKVEHVDGLMDTRTSSMRVEEMGLISEAASPRSVFSQLVNPKGR